MKKYLIGAFLGITLILTLAATNLPQSWTWDKTSQWFSVLMKDGGGTKFVAGAPKQYVTTTGDTTFGNCSSSGTTFKVCGTSISLSRAVAIPYKTSDGTWRIRGQVSFSGMTGASRIIALNGVSFKSNQNVSCSQGSDGTTYSIATSTGSSNGSIASNWSVTTNLGIYCFVDAELDSKPTWADAN